MDFKQYKGKNILAWLWFDPDYYNPDKGNTVCYVYPRVLVNKFHYELIDPADFPKHGSIRVNINGGDTAEDLYERFGSFVSLKINEDDPYPNYDGNNMYSLRYNSSFGRTNSGIWIEKFSGKDFYQIIDVDSDISTLINTRSIPEPDCTIRSNGEVTATLYYQPVISAVQFENDLTLFRTTKPPAGNPDYYTPDFVLKFASSEDDEEYAIFDAKFSSRANIKKHSLPEVIRKYSCEISAASRSSAPKMVWVLQGRVNGSENAIWKYHNSQLASTYRPITSFGIVSINTAVEIRQRLWNEIRSSISLLQ